MTNETTPPEIEINHARSAALLAIGDIGRHLLKPQIPEDKAIQNITQLFKLDGIDHTTDHDIEVQIILPSREDIKQQAERVLANSLEIWGGKIPDDRFKPLEPFVDEVLAPYFDENGDGKTWETTLSKGAANIHIKATPNDGTMMHYYDGMDDMEGIIIEGFKIDSSGLHTRGNFGALADLAYLTNRMNTPDGHFEKFDEYIIVEPEHTLAMLGEYTKATGEFRNSLVCGQNFLHALEQQHPDDPNGKACSLAGLEGLLLHEKAHAVHGDVQVHLHPKLTETKHIASATSEVMQQYRSLLTKHPEEVAETLLSLSNDDIATAEQQAQGIAATLKQMELTIVGFADQLESLPAFTQPDPFEMIQDLTLERSGTSTIKKAINALESPPEPQLSSDDATLLRLAAMHTTAGNANGSDRHELGQKIQKIFDRYPLSDALVERFEQIESFFQAYNQAKELLADAYAVEHMSQRSAAIEAEDFLLDLHDKEWFEGNGISEEDYQAVIDGTIPADKTVAKIIEARLAGHEEPQFPFTHPAKNDRRNFIADLVEAFDELEAQSFADKVDASRQTADQRTR